MLPFVYNAEEDTRGNGAVQESEVGYYDSYRQNQQRGYEQKDHNQSDYYRDQDYRDSAAEREPRNTRDDYDRGRGRHKSRSRSRSWSRGRHERNRDRRSRSRDRYRRDRSRSRSKSPRNSRRRRSRSRDADRDRARGRDFEKASAFPVNKLVITSMPSNIDKNMITLALASSGYLPQDIRIMNKFDKAAGCARSFGFIDFSDVSTATRWMDDNKGILELSDGRRLRVEYAKGDLGFSGRRADNDWICAHCAMNNFFKRENCFKCDIPKESSMLLERQGVHMSGINPCDTLLLRNLPDGCETSTIFENLANYISLSSISMVQISESRSYAYVQMKSTAEAELLLNNSYKTPIQIAGKDILTNYCIHPMSKIIQNQMTILNAGTPTALGAAPASQVSGAEVAHAAMMKAAALRHASSQVGKMLSRNAPPPQISQQPLAAPVVTDFSVPPPTMINTSVPPPSMASMSAQTKNGIIGITPTPRGVFPKYVTPNPMMFVVDNASGYYLDRVTNFFYDVTTTYYYNNEARQWCYFDATYQTYFPVENNPAADASIAVVDPSAQVGKQVEEEISKDPKSKTAADLAKDMLKWAKKQEKIKVQMSIKPLVKQLETKSAFHSANSSSGKSERQTISPSDDDDEEDERRSQEKELVKVREPKETPSTTRNVNEEREAMERALIDESKKMCLLCKRAFPSLDVLRKHIDKSDLHQKNLEEKRAEWNRQNVEPVAERSDDFPGFSGAEFSMPKMVYRDRAKERREQFGSDPSGLVQEHKKVAVVRSEESIRRESEEAAQRPLDDKNIGNKLLKSMGWKEGQGVGRNGQGIVAPIQAERFVAGAGLGSAGARQTGGVEATHREKTRAALFSRYHQT